MNLLYLLAALITSECAECDEDEKMHIGSVVINRMHSGLFPECVEDVVYQPGQFDGVATNLFYPAPENIGIAAKLLMHGSIIDKKILFFYSRKKSREWKWIQRLQTVIECKHHNFCIYGNSNK